MKKIIDFFRTALSNKGIASSTRLNVFLVVIQFSVVATAGYIVVLIYFPNLIIEYLMILIGAMLGAMGIKATEKIKSVNNLESNKNETGS